MANWGSISPYFPLPSPSDCQQKIDVLAVHGGKSLTPFVRTSPRIFVEPDYARPEQVDTAINQLKEYILHDFGRAFSDNLDPSQIADVDPMKIHLKDMPIRPTKRTSCRALPFHLVGEAEAHIKGLVDAGVICAIAEPTTFCASSNCLRKPSRGLCLVSDFCPLNSCSECIGLLFWSAN